jgi:uncharacterized phage protein (TIGR02218 family)
MKSLTTELRAHFGQDCTSLALIFKAKRADGQLFGFTTFDQDITFDIGDGDGSITYLAETGIANTASVAKDDLSVDNQDVTGFLDSTVITVADIRAGLWNDAEIEIAIVNWADLTQGCLKLRKGNTGQITLKNGVFTSEVRGLAQKLTNQIVYTYGPLCRAELGSGLNGIDLNSTWLCKVDLAALRETGSVSSSADALHITPVAGLTGTSGYFNDGVLAFTSGVMDGFKMEVKSWNGTVITLYLPMPLQPGNGDTFTIEPGCNKTIADCQDKFNNIVNFRGEPFIPGITTITQYPDAK